MAARTKKIRHDEETRAKIQAAQIINRLYDNVMGTVELSNAQVSSAKTLLNKVLPDLSSVTHSGDEDNPINVVTKVEIEVVKPDAEKA